MRRKKQAEPVDWMTNETRELVLTGAQAGSLLWLCVKELMAVKLDTPEDFIHMEDVLTVADRLRLMMGYSLEEWAKQLAEIGRPSPDVLRLLARLR